MSANAQKTPFVKSLKDFVDTQREDAEDVKAKAYPASVLEVDSTGTIVTIQIEIEDDVITFPNIQCPLFGPEWVRFPINKGVKGMAVPADVYMGGMSGLGDGTATMDQRGNLSTYIFIPCGNTSFDDVEDAKQTEMYGRDSKGVFIRTGDKKVKLHVGPEGDIPATTPVEANVGPTEDGPNNVLRLKTLVSATNDSDAASKGIPLFGLYHTSGTVKVRIS